jgi:HK97 family phage prohead protease
MSQFEKKHVRLPFETKEINEEGQFVGFASIYGNVDLGGDIVVPGAFAKTMEKNKIAPVYDDHKIRVGVADLEDTDIGLKAIGRLNLNKQSGRDAYSDLKFYRDNGMPMGMSFGYMPVKGKTEMKDGLRLLKEVKLFEVTLTMTPMNELAGVLDVKSAEDTLADHFAEWELLLAEVKAGRKISKDRLQRLNSIIQEIQSLIDGAVPEVSESTLIDEPTGGKASEPDYHSLLSSFDKFSLKGISQWN